MPSRVITRGGSPARSSPIRKMRPPSGVRYPVIRFRNVVLPDPFAPTIPTSSPPWLSTLIRLAAMTIPNDLERSTVFRIAASRTRHLAGPPPEPGGQGLVDRPESAGPEEDDREHDDPEGHLPFVREVLGGVRADELEGDRADQRTENARISSEERHEDEVAGLNPEGVLRHDVSHREGSQAAAHSTERPRDDVGDVHHAPHRLARVLDPDLVIAESSEVEAQGRGQEAMDDVDDDARDTERRVVQEVPEVLAWRDISEKLWDPHAQPVGPPGEPVELEKDTVEHHGERQVEHREEDFAIPRHDQSDEGGHPGAEQRPHGEQHHDVAEVKPLDAEADGISACGIEHGRAEGHLVGPEEERHRQDG